MISPPVTRRPPTVVLFDMDGVLRHWRAEVFAAAEREAGLPRGVLTRAAFSVPEYERGVRGHVTYADWCRATERVLAQAYSPEAAARAVQAWRRYPGHLDPAVVQLIGEVSRGSRVGLLSNAHDSLRADLERLNIRSIFERVVCSAEEGLAKPDPEIYWRAATAFRVDPTACLFVDDQFANVRAAQSIGMRAHHFTGTHQLRSSLQQLGVIAACAPASRRTVRWVPHARGSAVPLTVHTTAAASTLRHTTPPSAR